MDNSVHGLIQTCYDTVVSPKKWPGFLEELTHVLDAKGCIIFEIDAAEENQLHVPLFNEAYEGDLLNSYMKLFERFELEEQKRFGQLAGQGDTIELVTDYQLFTDDEARSNRPNVQALGSFGIGHRAFALLDKDNRSRYRFSVQHSGRHGVVSDGEVDILKQILPHMAKALQLGRPFLERAETHEGLVVALSQLDIGVSILDRSGRELFANEEHERQCEVYGTFRKSSDGSLRLNANGDSTRLNALLTDMLKHGQFGARPRREAIALEGAGLVGAICLEITPRPEGGAIVFSFDTSRAVQFDSQIICKMFALTETEALVLGMVAEGLTNAQIAERRNRSTETVNAQLKSILSKTNCANRTQVVRLLLNFGAQRIRPL